MMMNGKEIPPKIKSFVSFQMSQIPRSQFALKKRQASTPTVTIPVLSIEEPHNGDKTKKNHSNGSSSGNGHKNGSFDNDVVIIEDDCFGVVQHEEVVETMENQFSVDVSPTKKKRSRKSKESTESKESDVGKKSDEAAKSPSKKSSKADERTTQSEESISEAFVAPTKTKVVKLTSDELTGSKGRRSNRNLENASTIVNVSTISISDQSTKVLQDDSMESVVTERRVSGRRSTRPIDDIKFSYRTHTPNDSLNETTNATIGSDPNSESLLTTPGTDRKRRPIHESMESIESPKRSRLDLSGLFSSFSSPVNLLRNKFKRANIASTPIAAGKDAMLNESSENDMKEIDLGKSGEITIECETEELKVITTPIKKSKCIIM